MVEHQYLFQYFQYQIYSNLYQYQLTYIAYLEICIHLFYEHHKCIYGTDLMQNFTRLLVGMPLLAAASIGIQINHRVL